MNNNNKIPVHAIILGYHENRTSTGEKKLKLLQFLIKTKVV